MSVSPHIRLSSQHREVRVVVALIVFASLSPQGLFLETFPEAALADVRHQIFQRDPPAQLDREAVRSGLPTRLQDTQERRRNAQRSQSPELAPPSLPRQFDPANAVGR